MGVIQQVRFAIRRVSPYAQRLLRLALHRPLLTLSFILLTALIIAYGIFKFVVFGGLGRWYYNYMLLKTPDALVRFIPKGGFDEPTEPPRWVEEIYTSQWMGHWKPPVLSRPVWKREDEDVVVIGMDWDEVNEGDQGAREQAPGPDLEAIPGLSMAEMAEEQRLDDLGDLPAVKTSAESDVKEKRSRRSISTRNTLILRSEKSATTHREPLPTSHPHTLSRRLSSPAIIKFHVFSTAVSESSYEKRKLIRRLSPIYQIPPEYRHLIDIKFVMGYNYLDTWGPPLNETMESKIREEEREYGDIMRIPDMWRGENLRDGKILQWIRDVGQGKDGRDAWYLFKVDDDAVINLPKLLDLLLSLDVHEPTYLGTSLVRWPSYHNHFTGFLTGFNYGLLKTLSQGIDKMAEKEVQAAWDDDVLTGELMYSLPSAPHCAHRDDGKCDPHAVPKHGWMPLPENPDPRTDLNRHDFERRAGDPAWLFTKGDLGMHGWWFKFPEYWEKEWNRAIKGKMWEPPAWLAKYADSG